MAWATPAGAFPLVRDISTTGVLGWHAIATTSFGDRAAFAHMFSGTARLDDVRPVTARGEYDAAVTLPIAPP